MNRYRKNTISFARSITSYLPDTQKQTSSALLSAYRCYTGDVPIKHQSRYPFCSHEGYLSNPAASLAGPHIEFMRYTSAMFAAERALPARNVKADENALAVNNVGRVSKARAPAYQGDKINLTSFHPSGRIFSCLRIALSSSDPSRRAEISVSRPERATIVEGGEKKKKPKNRVNPMLIQ